MHADSSPSSFATKDAPDAELAARVTTLEEQIAAILERNQRVESNKAWETSRSRLLSITAITYVTMVLVFTVLDSRRAFVEALVPTTGFFLSTLSLSIVRRMWARGSKHKTEQ